MNSLQRKTYIDKISDYYRIIDFAVVANLKLKELHVIVYKHILKLDDKFYDIATSSEIVHFEGIDMSHLEGNQTSQIRTLKLTDGKLNNASD